MKKITNESLGAVYTHTHTGSLKENKKKNIKGITLVALVVTIIILLILAGISISALTQTGLFGKAKQAKDKYGNAQKNENETLENFEDNINGYITIGATRDSQVMVQILWENPDKELKTFEAKQTINLANDNYDYFDIIFKYYNDEPDYFTQRIYKGYSFALQTGSGYSNKVAKRNFNYINDTTFKSENGYWGSEIANNNVCIPVKIIGYKY